MAKGISISPLISSRPRKRSRTSTQATSVPKTSWTATTTRLILIVSQKAASTSGWLSALKMARDALLEGAGDQGDDRRQDQDANVEQDDRDQDPPGPGLAGGGRALESLSVPVQLFAGHGFSFSLRRCSQPTTRIRLKAMATMTIDTALAPSRFSDSTSPRT